MKTITIEISDETNANLEELARRCSEIDDARVGATTHGPLTVVELLAMLAEDAAMLMSRPGAWEADHMRTLLASHGYEL